MPRSVARTARFLPFLVVLTVPAFAVGLDWQAQAQKPDPPSGAITGVVVDGAGEVVPEAFVSLAATPSRLIASQTRQVTDDKGRFAFVNLPGGVSYTISATRFGYLAGGYGRDAMPTDPLRAIPLKQDEWIPDIKVTIWKPGSISGMVRDETGEPVVGVVVRALHKVRIYGRDDYVAGPLTRTDDRGAYRLSDLSPGRYVLQVPSVQASVPGTALPAPEPRPALRPLGPGFQEVLDLMDVDDTTRLAIGRYAVPPPPQNGRQMAYPIIFHPSTSAVADATVIALKYGEDRGSVDLTLAPAVAVRISGIVDGPPESLRMLTLRLLPAGLESLGFGAEAATALVAPDGRFTFINVPAGSYIIDAPNNVSELSTVPGEIGVRRALQGPPTTPVTGASMTDVDLIPGMRLTSYAYRGGTGYSGRASITVGGSDVTGVVVRMRPAGTMTGRLIVERDPARTDASPTQQFGIELDPIGGQLSVGVPGRWGRTSDPGPFTVRDITPGQFWLRVRAGNVNSDWLVKSVTWNGRDYTNTPFDTTDTTTFTDVVVTITNAAPELTGQVRGTEELKAEETMVIAFPVEPALWNNTGLWPARVKSAAVSSAHSYRFASLPAGDYLVVAVNRSFTNTWRDPEFIARAARSASRVTLTWGAKSALDVNVAVIR